MVYCDAMYLMYCNVCIRVFSSIGVCSYLPAFLQCVHAYVYFKPLYVFIRVFMSVGVFLYTTLSRFQNLYTHTCSHIYIRFSKYSRVFIRIIVSEERRRIYTYQWALITIVMRDAEPLGQIPTTSQEAK